MNMSEPLPLKEESTSYLSSVDKLQQAKRQIAAMTEQERWSFYETDAFAEALTEHFRQAKAKALTGNGDFYARH